ncbi:MAG: hypothetical protein EAZ15_01345 [Sphingobacteriales bacterium]|nr:MAG: hypothetical protein EAZ15_01345 [Sphingobacteriales bacterium]
MDNKEINLDKLTEIEEIKSIIKLYDEAKHYLENFDWCASVKNGWFDEDFRVHDKLGVFLFEIEPLNDSIDDFIWVIVGDLPSVYLDKSVKSGLEALEIYCDLMQDWVDNIRDGKTVSECYPIPAEPNLENAELLNNRILFIRQEILTGDKE